MDRRKFPGLPEEILPIEGLEAETAAPELIDTTGLSLEELAEAIAEQRRAATREDQASLGDDEEKSNPRRGGAFGGALKRRILLTDSNRMKSFTSESDIALVTPANIRDRIFPNTRVNQSFDGVLFTAAEYAAVTVSAPELAQRVGAKVMAHTTDRSPTARHQRREEVVATALEQRHKVVTREIERLVEASDKLGRLKKEIRTPGYSHMSLDEMNALMANAETIFMSMFEAIVESDDALDDTRVYSLSGALLYNLTSDDYKTTFELWKSMTNLGFNWTNRKIVSLIKVQHGIEARTAHDKQPVGL